MTPLLILVCAGITVACLAWFRFDAVSKGTGIAKAISNDLTTFQDKFGNRVDAHQFVKSIVEEANRIDRFKVGGSGAIGMRLGDGDFAGAALVTAGKIAVDGAVSVLGKLAKSFFGAGERAIVSDGPKSEEQLNWELAIRRNLDRLFFSRRSASRFKTAMIIVAVAGGLGALVAYSFQTDQ